MAAVLKILSPGILASLQDEGRQGYAGFGVPRSGAADSLSLQLGNALVGNTPFETAIEFRFLGPKVIAEGGRIRLGLAGDVTAEHKFADSGESIAIKPWQSLTLDDGDVLAVDPLKDGATGYLTVEGGFDLAPVLDSCSTYARARLGGVNGLPLQAGDKIQTKQLHPQDGLERIVSDPISTLTKTIRVLAGPQDDYFSEVEISKFIGGHYKVSSDVDRMGIRLEGPELEPLPEKGSDLISDGIVPGAIQVPGSGQPIILFVDCQTIGGYPKIGVVITSDLPLLGQLVPGNEICFQLVSLEEAQAARKARKSELERAISSIQDYFGEGVMDLKALYEVNLIGGVVNASLTGHFPGHLEGGTNEKN
ncbi:biotin-dependent carboxyltransferase family protein [Kiloniella sp. EL199]|uniref:5-oxoprolinase subunit C family protein n=1 Tax=Kiloniella sp. EL199 TaxID=2107581 RepID=UPI000EA40B70|nr:biotin-dependent carboxyltransferase family protein [Kiloniella sp. EL199]